MLETDSSPSNIYVLKLVKDIRKLLVPLYLKNVDRFSALVTTIYNSAHNTAIEISKAVTPEADTFFNNLSIDGNENLLLDLQNDAGKIKLTKLTKYHNPSRGDDVLKILKSKLTDIKARTLINIENNIKDQCSEDTHYFSWSGLDLGDKSMSLEQRLEKLASIIELYCVDTLFANTQIKLRRT